jgi:hypothetical protein
MKIATLLALAFALHSPARADFSYTITHKATGGSMGAALAAGASGTTKFYVKGSKMKTDDGQHATIIDLDAQTVTTIDHNMKTIAVRSLKDVAQAAKAPAVSIDVRETGQRKMINGFDAKEVILSMDFDLSQQAPGVAGKARLEDDVWVTSDVPGADELRSFYEKNANRLPGANLQQFTEEVQKKLASMHGVPVEQVIRMKQAGSAATAMPQLSAAQAAQMEQARARLEAMKAQGGPAAAAAEQALARMGGVTPAANSGSLLEMTLDSSGFSTVPIPDSVFAIPAGYQKLGGK